MAGQRRVLEDQRPQVRDQLPRRQWLIRHVAGDGGAYLIGGARVGYGKVGEAGQVLRPQGNDFIAELPGALRGPIEIRDGRQEIACRHYVEVIEDVEVVEV